MTWLTDDRGNKCSVEFFGSREAAQAALDGLKNCDNCTNCSDCSDCSECSYCSECSRCSRCSDCSYCSYCSDCSDCSYCSECSRCSYCSECSRCSRCSYCSRCKGASPIEGSAKRFAVPKVADLHKRVFEAASQPKALAMGNWHTCEKTHCRAGWIVALAGAEGRALEAFYNTELAAMLIYHESTGERINPARFYDSNEDALADMKRLAESAA